VTWDIDDNRIATYDITNLGALGGNDIALGVSDVNSSTTRHPALLFTVFDNLVVTNAPEPASASLLVIGAAAMIRRRQR
jgi:hypothetical protein